MKYRTLIEVVTEAENESEAADIAGEYLSGNIVSGIQMKCSTKPACNANVFAIALLVLLPLGIIFSVHTKPGQQITGTTSSFNAVQPPLKTSNSEYNNIGFKKAWEKEQARETLDHIKKIN